MLTSGHDEPVGFAFVPRYIDLRHEERGWIRHGFKVRPDVEALGAGEPVTLGEAALPAGRYEGVRIGYFAVWSRGDADSGVPEDKSIVQDDVWVMRPFCLDGRTDEELVLAVFDDHPSAGVGGPTFKVASAPECDP